MRAVTVFRYNLSNRTDCQDLCCFFVDKDFLETIIYIYIYIYVYIYIYMCVCVYVYIYIYIYSADVYRLISIYTRPHLMKKPIDEKPRSQRGRANYFSLVSFLWGWVRSFWRGGNLSEDLTVPYGNHIFFMFLLASRARHVHFCWRSFF